MNLRSVCLIILLIPVIASTQSRSRNSRNVIPGIGADLPPYAAQAMRRQFDKMIDDRRATQRKAVSAARRSLAKYRSDPEADGADRLAAEAGFLYAFGGDEKNADSAFEELNESHPESVWNYEGQLARFDIAAEQRLDLAAMKETIDPLVPWTESLIPDRGPKPAAVSLGEGRTSPFDKLPVQYPGPPIVKVTEDGFEVEQREQSSIAAGILHRAGLVAWLTGEVQPAQDFFQRALQFDPRLGNHLVPLALMVTRGASFRPSPIDFQERTNDINRLILLADVYTNSTEVYRTEQLWENLLKQHKKDLSKPQRSYAEMQHSLAVSNLTSPLEKDSKKIIEGYELSQKLDPTSAWADRALFLAGNAAWNLNRDFEAAIALWQRQLDDYADRPFAANAAYRIGIAYEQLKKWKEAKDAFTLVLEKYPDSGHEKLANDHLRKLPRN